MHVISSERQFGGDVVKIAEKLLDPQSHYLSIGSPRQKEKSKDEEQAWLKIKPAEGLQIDFSNEAPKNWALDEELSERQYGDLFHQVMSSIKTEGDIDRALKCCIDASQASMFSNMKQEIQTILRHPEIGHLFDTDSQHYNERDLKSDKWRNIPARLYYFKE